MNCEGTLHVHHRTSKQNSAILSTQCGLVSTMNNWKEMKWIRVIQSQQCISWLLMRAWSTRVRKYSESQVPLVNEEDIPC